MDAGKPDPARPQELEPPGDETPPSAAGSMARAVGVALLFLVVVAGILWWRGEGELLGLLGRQDRTWQAMQERGAWRVGMDPSFPPFQSLDEGGRPVGFDVDLARRMAEDWGLALEIVPLGFDSLLDALQAGRIDSVVSALPFDPRATRDFAYSPPYFEAGIRLAVRPGSPITQTEDLAGLRVAVEWGSTGDMVARRYRRETPTLEIVPFETPDEAIQGMLRDPTLDALLIDNVSLRLAQGEGAMLAAVGPALEGNAYVIASPVRATVLNAHIRDTLARLIDVGALEELEDRWFGPMPP